MGVAASVFLTKCYRITLLALAPYPIVHRSAGAPVDQGAATAVLEVQRL